MTKTQAMEILNGFIECQEKKTSLMKRYNTEQCCICDVVTTTKEKYIHVFVGISLLASALEKALSVAADDVMFEYDRYFFYYRGYEIFQLGKDSDKVPWTQLCSYSRS